MPEVGHTQRIESAETAEEPIIRLPNDEHRIRQLEAKKAEYERRLGEQGAAQPYSHHDLSQHPGTRMKLAILSRLLEVGEVPTWTFSMEFAKENEGIAALLGPEDYEKEWNNAAGVINDYCETGGANILRGAGLPTVEQ